jgi:hypothetical protein
METSGLENSYVFMYSKVSAKMMATRSLVTQAIRAEIATQDLVKSPLMVGIASN